ncbi:MAG: hypothetical protein ACP5SI_09130 [Chloroflexia bacterium]
MTVPQGRPQPWKIALLAACGLLLLVGLNLGTEEVYHRYLHRPVSPTRVTGSPLPLPSPSLSLPTPVPSPTPLAKPPDGQWELLVRRLFFHELLLKASQELLRAETYVASGELKQAERELIAVEATLEQASQYADESLAGPVQDLQRDLSRLREDLYLRPERLREGMLRLWQRLDALIGQ